MTIAKPCQFEMVLNAVCSEHAYNNIIVWSLKTEIRVRRKILTHCKSYHPINKRYVSVPLWFIMQVSIYSISVSSHNSVRANKKRFIYPVLVYSISACFECIHSSSGTDHMSYQNRVDKTEQVNNSLLKLCCVSWWIHDELFIWSLALTPYTSL